jgi:nicotinamidase-related amidase
MEVESLIVTGVTTSVCVGLVACQAAYRGFQVIVAEDACTELSEELHRRCAAVSCPSFLAGCATLTSC